MAVHDDRSIRVERGGRLAGELCERNVDRAGEVFVLIFLWRQDFNQLGAFRDQSLHAIPVNVRWHGALLLRQSRMSSVFATIIRAASTKPIPGERRAWPAPRLSYHILHPATALCHIGLKVISSLIFPLHEQEDFSRTIPPSHRRSRRNSSRSPAQRGVGCREECEFCSFQ
jgi:hypothetical protein